LHLRAISLAGFKTFARPTEIRFEAGVTAIVGPNGSGKTNIVDAFKWVLGESQARDLRGKRMDEVIYAGGERRGRASVAEVTIVIDNTDGRLPVDYSEVGIRRRLDRGGQSDYFLNGSRVRRRDLLDLLASTGLTTDSYAIVDQRDIESIISSTPDQRRALIEEAAQVRGVKAKRTEAAVRLEELAGNLLRLEDLRVEIQPRLDALRVQAGAARAAAEAQSRLELLRGSLVWEEWREAREVERRARTQLQSVQRRLAEARAQAEVAEVEFKRWRRELEAAQDRRLQRQRQIGELKLEVSRAEHELEMAGERARSQSALADAARDEATELAGRDQAAQALKEQLRAELEAASAELAAVPDPPPLPRAEDPDGAGEARREADRLRREVATAQSELAAARTRRQFLEESIERLRAQVESAEAELAGAERRHVELVSAAGRAGEASAALARAEAQLEGLAALRPDSGGAGALRLTEVLRPEPGYELALAAVLGPLAEAWVAVTEREADRLAGTADNQVTVLFPDAPGQAEPGSLWERVECRPGFEALGRRLLGRVVVGRDVSLEGVYREPGLIRAGPDAAALLEARRRGLEAEVERFRPEAGQAGTLLDALRKADSELQALRLAAAGAARLGENQMQLEKARSAETVVAGRLPGLESRSQEAQEGVDRIVLAAESHQRALAEQRAEARRLELEALRWRDRIGDLQRQMAGVDADLSKLAEQREARERRAAAATREAHAAAARLPDLDLALGEARARMDTVAADSPAEEAELAAGARRLVELEEARVDARLRVTTFEGHHGLISRDAELAQARLEEIRSRLPEGLAPEEIPGGRAREREMHALEKRLVEIGPTNPLAEAEYVELEERHSLLAGQLEDVVAARQDLETLVERLRAEEESRYEAVFGAVAINFQETFVELSAGGRATLQHAPGADGPRSGVEILVQPPRKRLQNVTLLSSGERSLTALALVLALEEVNPAPFTILDEVDAALDDANVRRFGDMLRRLGQHRQLLVITHNHLTMASCGALYGVHLDESGSSHLVSVRLEDIRPNQRAASATA
jgi:chromosome segregation protein